jgi:hypothetical protein
LEIRRLEIEALLIEALMVEALLVKRDRRILESFSMLNQRSPSKLLLKKLPLRKLEKTQET